jgi:hypothetical protein
MKQYLVPIFVLAAALAQAQGPRQSDQKVSMATVAPQPSVAPAKPLSGLRQLTPEERAELRRQLYQYSQYARPAAKGF